MNGPASMCIIFKCCMSELNKIHVDMYSYEIDKESTIFRYDLTDQLGCNGNRK